MATAPARAADVDAVVEVDRVHVAHADAAGGDRLADFRRLVGAVDPVERVVIALKEIERPRAERIVPPALERSVSDIGPELGPALHDGGGRHPGWPFLHLPDRCATGPGVGLHAGCNPIFDRLVVGQHEIKMLAAGVDDDRAGPFAGLVLDLVADVGDAPLIRLREGHHLLVALGEFGVGQARLDHRRATARHRADGESHPEKNTVRLHAHPARLDWLRLRSP